MLTNKMLDKLNEQINVEFYSSNLYLQMASWCESKGLEGCADFLKAHADEEMGHMHRLFTYVNECGAMAKLGAIDARAPTGLLVHCTVRFDQGRHIGHMYPDALTIQADRIVRVLVVLVVDGKRGQAGEIAPRLFRQLRQLDRRILQRQADAPRVGVEDPFPIADLNQQPVRIFPALLVPQLSQDAAVLALTLYFIPIPDQPFLAVGFRLYLVDWQGGAGHVSLDKRRLFDDRQAIGHTIAYVDQLFALLLVKVDSRINPHWT